MRKLITSTAIIIALASSVSANDLNGSLNTNNNNGITINTSEAESNHTVTNVIEHKGGYNDTQTVNQNVNQRSQSQTHATVSNLTTSGQDTCFGSSTQGLSIAGASLSNGSTVVDENCVRMKNVKLFHSLGLTDAAIALMLQDPDNAAAFLIAYPDLATKFGLQKPWQNPDQ